MKLKTTALASTAFSICFWAAAAYAADVAAPAPPKPSNTITLESAPEFYDLAGTGHGAGDLNDYYFKLGLSHSFDNNLVLGGIYIGNSGTGRNILGNNIRISTTV